MSLPRSSSLQSFLGQLTAVGLLCRQIFISGALPCCCAGQGILSEIQTVSNAFWSSSWCTDPLASVNSVVTNTTLLYGTWVEMSRNEASRHCVKGCFSATQYHLREWDWLSSPSLLPSFLPPSLLPMRLNPRGQSDTIFPTFL